GSERDLDEQIHQCAHAAKQTIPTILGAAPPNPPSSAAKILRKTADRNRSIAHAGQCCETDMSATVVEEILINLVGDRKEIVAYRDIGDVLELRARKYFPRWVARRVNKDDFRPRRNRAFKFVG